MIDNQEKVHTQLHKFDKIVCKDINGANVKQLYAHEIALVGTQTNSAINVHLKIFTYDSTPFTIVSLKEWLSKNNLTSKESLMVASGARYINDTSIAIIGGLYVNNETLYLEGIQFTFDFSNSKISRTEYHDSFAYVYPTDTVFELF